MINRLARETAVAAFRGDERWAGMRIFPFQKVAGADGLFTLFVCSGGDQTGSLWFWDANAGSFEFCVSGGRRLHRTDFFLQDTVAGL